MSIIKDGQGKGYAAAVDELGRIQTNTVVVAHEQHHAVEYQNLFFSSFSLTTADTNEAPVAFLRSDHTAREYEIYDVRVSSTANATIRIYVNSTYTSGGTVSVPVNMNLSSGVTPLVTTYEGGASDDLVVAANDLLFASHLGSYDHDVYQFKGSLIIPVNKGITVTAETSAGATVLCDMNYAHNPVGSTG